MDVLLVLALAGLAATIAVGVSLTWVQQQAARSAIYQVQSYLQLTRAQAVTRNHACRFVLDRDGRRMRVVDLNDPAVDHDDLVLEAMTLSPAVRLGRPDGGRAVTLAPHVDGHHQATFESTGAVSAGAGGEIVLAGGGGFHRVTLYGAGGVRVQRWRNGAWTSEM